jgi:hypothetical protein
MEDLFGALDEYVERVSLEPDAIGEDNFTTRVAMAALDDIVQQAGLVADPEEAALLLPGGEEHLRHWRLMASRMEGSALGSVYIFESNNNPTQQQLAQFILTVDHFIGFSLNSI